VVGDVVGRDSHENDGALGAAPNIAARLQAMCEPGEVVISDTTAALLPASIKLRPLDRKSEKADFGTVHPFCVVDVPRDPASGRSLSASGLVGRQGTLERLRKGAARGRAGPVALFVWGEAGVGKSRLVHELTGAKRDAGALAAHRMQRLRPAVAAASVPRVAARARGRIGGGAGCRSGQHAVRPPAPHLRSAPRRVARRCAEHRPADRGPALGRLDDGTVRCGAAGQTRPRH
jgi:hypothetical protein